MSDDCLSTSALLRQAGAELTEVRRQFMAATTLLAATSERAQEAEFRRWQAEAELVSARVEACRLRSALDAAESELARLRRAADHV